MTTAEPTAVASAASPLEGDGFRNVVETYGQRLYALAYRMTGNAHDAEDLVQESFLRAYRHRRHFQGRSSLCTWLYRICTNAALDHLRSRKHAGSAQPEIEACVSPGASPERLLLSRELCLRLRAAMASLSARERAAFILRHYEGQSLENIGAILGLRTAATKNTVFRAVRKLRTALASQRGAA
ncbi:MAG: RNA polymerase sigma factor [Terriglobales bacterium]